jgi:sodium transport system ATP-binding protein
MVRTDSLSKTFVDAKKGEVRAVKGVSLEVPAGTIFGLLGANGAGKTTFLRMLSTVLQPSSGTATVAGFDVAKDPQRVRESIGFLSSSTALYGRLTAREMLDYFAGLYGLEGATKKQRIDELVDQLKIGEFAHRLCDKLSTGQKQRVSIARTLLHRPPVLFFDEPTSGLDVIMAQEVMRFVDEMRGEGKTVFYCTHIMSEAERLCDRLAVIHEGELRGEGTVAELKAKTGEATLEKAFLNLVGVSA